MRDVVVDYQDGYVAQLLPGRIRVAALEDGFMGENGEPERAPPAGLAGDTVVPTHQRNQLAADGQAEAGPAVLAGGRRIRLGERLKDRTDLVGFDAVTRVGYLEPEDRLQGDQARSG